MIVFVLEKGSMRVGKDAMVFTKNGKSCSVGFLSQTFLDAIQATEVLVPMCTWDNVGTNIIWVLPSQDWKIIGDEKQAEKGLNIITNYTPWETEAAVRNEFKEIPNTGTLIHIFNLRFLPDFVFLRA